MVTRFGVCVMFVLSLASAAVAQSPATLTVEVKSGAVPMAGATVLVNGGSHVTDAQGSLTVTVPPGSVTLTAVKAGLAPVTTSVTVEAGARQTIVIDLPMQPTITEEVVVSATRTGKRLEDQPMRVEVLGRDEIEEKMLMTPGDITMMLNEMGGMRVQTTSPSLGAASVRIQGMRGRYTRFFSDGLPLFGDVGGLGLLQIPPMDLGQVEVIKGVASSQYGAGAMGGVVNLVSRRPGALAAHEVLLNRSTRGGTDAVAFFGAPLTHGWAYTLLAGGHWQERTDVNGDNWADLPGYTRAVVRPRVFWDGGDGRTFFATLGFTGEDRAGGGTPDGSTYREALDTRRVDGGAVGQLLLRRRYLLSARIAVMHQRHRHRFGQEVERDRHEKAFGEMAIRTAAGRHTLVGGTALDYDDYDPHDVRPFAYTYAIPGVFLQDDVEVARWLSVSASARLDRHSRYGTFVSPRVSALARHGAWTSRLTAGTGFFGPTPFTDETEAAGLTRLRVRGPLRAEQGRSASFDIGRTDGPASYSFTAFSSSVRHPIEVDRSVGLLMTNAASPTVTRGFELLSTLRLASYAVTGTYTHVRVSEAESGVSGDAALVPRHSAGVVVMWDRDRVGRVGVEGYYTGAQRLRDNPFSARSRAYFTLGILAERQFGQLRLFINGENLTDARQTRWEPLVLPVRAPDGRWTVDAWSPLEGRNINGGIRVQF